MLNEHNPTSKRPFRPLMITARYACDCVNREVLTESVVIDMDMSEEVFIWSMRQLLASVKHEVAQHLLPKERDDAEEAKSA